MSYRWFSDETSLHVVRGAAANAVVEETRIIQTADGYNGFNVEFVVTGAQTDRYHIHFGGNGSVNRDQLGTRVKTIKLKGATPTQDLNLVKLNDGTDPLPFSQFIQNEAAGFPNHQALLNKLAAAWRAYRGV